MKKNENQNFEQRLLKTAVGSVLDKNREYEGKHIGETCYIFGNGASLKSMDLSVFGDKCSIGLNFICLHKDIRKLNMSYCVLVHPFFLYPYFKNVYTGKYQANTRGLLFKLLMRSHAEMKIFTSISNAFGARGLNTNYFHHFGNRKCDINKCDPTGEFSFMAGALYSAIGMAIYMGFTKAILIGCDSAFSPITQGYFYGAGGPEKSDRFENNYEHLFSEVEDHIKLSIVTDNSESSWLPFIKYEDFSGTELSYKENHDIVDDVYLDILDKAYQKKEFGVPIYKS